MIPNLFFLLLTVAAWQFDTPRGDLIAIAAGLAWALSFTTYPRVQGL